MKKARSGTATLRLFRFTWPALLEGPVASGESSRYLLVRVKDFATVVARDRPGSNPTKTVQYEVIPAVRTATMWDDQPDRRGHRAGVIVQALWLAPRRSSRFNRRERERRLQPDLVRGDVRSRYCGSEGSASERT